MVAGSFGSAGGYGWDVIGDYRSSSCCNGGDCGWDVGDFGRGVIGSYEASCCTGGDCGWDVMAGWSNSNTSNTTSGAATTAATGPWCKLWASERRPVAMRAPDTLAEIVPLP